MGQRWPWAAAGADGYYWLLHRRMPELGASGGRLGPGTVAGPGWRRGMQIIKGDAPAHFCCCTPLRRYNTHHLLTAQPSIVTTTLQSLSPILPNNTPPQPTCAPPPSSLLPLPSLLLRLSRYVSNASSHTRVTRSNHAAVLRRPLPPDQPPCPDQLPGCGYRPVLRRNCHSHSASRRHRAAPCCH